MTQRRILVSLVLACSFIILSVSGIWMFFSAYSEGLEIVHYTFGFLFSLTALVHIANNNRSLQQYLKKSKRKK
ncbi:MAG: DUF4405 domain-containing protein [Cyclobacteriaceae bacterium]